MRSERGQTATEYMLLISVIVVAVVGAAYTFVPTFKDGTDALARDVSSILASGEIGGVGLDRSGGGGSGSTTGAASNGTVGGSPSFNTSGTTGGYSPMGTGGGGYNGGLGSPSNPPSNNSNAGPSIININDNGRNPPTVQPAVYHPPPNRGPVLYSA